jgi:hypothetical protein
MPRRSRIADLNQRLHVLGVPLVRRLVQLVRPLSRVEHVGNAVAREILVERLGVQAERARECRRANEIRAGRTGSKHEHARVAGLRPRGRLRVGDAARPDDAQIAETISRDAVLALLECPIQDANPRVAVGRHEKGERLEKQVVSVERRDADDEQQEPEEHASHPSPWVRSGAVE